MTDEVWRPVVGFEGWYEVSSRGRVRRVGGRPLRPATNSWGYRYVALSRRGVAVTRNVHALVPELRHDESNDEVCNYRAR